MRSLRQNMRFLGFPRQTQLCGTVSSNCKRSTSLLRKATLLNKKLLSVSANERFWSLTYQFHKCSIVLKSDYPIAFGLFCQEKVGLSKKLRINVARIYRHITKQPKVVLIKKHYLRRNITYHQIVLFRKAF